MQSQEATGTAPDVARIHLLAGLARVDPRTVARVLAGQPVRRASAERVASAAASLEPKKVRRGRARAAA